jgi:hypothetical protein
MIVSRTVQDLMVPFSLIPKNPADQPVADVVDV